MIKNDNNIDDIPEEGNVNEINRINKFNDTLTLNKRSILTNNVAVTNKEESNLGKIFKERHNQSIKAMENTKNKISEWLVEDKNVLNFRVNIIDNMDKFLSSDLEFSEKNGKITIEQPKNWCKIKVPEKSENSSNGSNGMNLILKNKILKLDNNYLCLRAMSVECEISLLMSGESNFYIFSRCDDKFSNKTVVCVISKELESARKFISFSVLESNDINDIYTITNLKKQEIPKQENYIKPLDISELKFIFIDNGDNKCFVFLEEQEQNSNMILLGDFYIPIENKSNIMFAVSGDLISLKKLNIRQTFRNSYVRYRNSSKNSINMQSCNCCQIW